MGLGRLAHLLRQLAQPLTAALVVAALGVTTAFVVLALRGHFDDGVSRIPVVLVTPAPTVSPPPPSESTSPTAPPPQGPENVTGTLAASVHIPLSSDNADAVTIPAGTPIQAQVMTVNGQLTVIDLVAGQPPAEGKGKHKDAISGSTATATTIMLATASGSLPMTIAQDSAVKGTDGHTLALEFSASQQ